MKQPKIYDCFSRGEVFTIEEARNKLGTTGNTLRKRLSELASKGYITPLRQGLYRLNSEQGLSIVENLSPLIIASKLSPQCYLGYKTALSFHAKKYWESKETIYVVSETKFNSFRLGNFNYFWSQKYERQGVEIHLIQDGVISYHVGITNLEKTLVDCLKRPSCCPPLAEFVALTRKIETVPDFNLMWEFIEESDIKLLYNRFGFLLEKNKDMWSVPNTLLKKLENRMSQKNTEWPISLSGEECSMSSANLMLPYMSEVLNRWKIQIYEPFSV